MRRAPSKESVTAGTRLDHVNEGRMSKFLDFFLSRWHRWSWKWEWGCGCFGGKSREPIQASGQFICFSFGTIWSLRGQNKQQTVDSATSLFASVPRAL